MKLDLLKKQWLDIVFEGRNKAYGAYDLRIKNPKMSIQALVIGAAIFTLLISIPVLAKFLPDSKDKDKTLDEKIVTVKLPPKKEIPKNLPPPPPPPPKVDQVKFVKPVVAKAEEVVEEPPKIEEVKDKKLGAENIKGDPNAAPTVEPVGNGPAAEIEDNSVHLLAGIEVRPDFPGGLNKFYEYVARNYRIPEEDGLNGKVYVSFVVEKDGSLTDIKVGRDIGFGTGKEAIRVLKNSPRWTPGEQNGKKVRVAYSLPITIKSPD
jgi:protein TonB